MAEKSKIVPVRFSFEELEVIKKFMEKYQMKSMNDVVRYGTAFLIGMIVGFEKLFASGNIEKIEAWQKEMRHQLSQNMSFNEFGESFRIFEKTVIPRVEQDLSEGVKIVKPFAKKRTIGRPKKPKRKRGKPKDLGYEK